MFLQCCTEDPVIGPLFCLSFYWFNKAYLSSPTSVELVSSFPGLEVLKGNEIARLCPYTLTHQISLRHQANTPVPDLPFPPAPAACLVHQRYLLVHTPCWVLQCMSCGARVVCLVALGCCVHLVHHRHVWCTKGILWMFGAPTVCFGAEYLWCTISHTEDTVYLPN